MSGIEFVITKYNIKNEDAVTHFTRPHYNCKCVPSQDIKRLCVEETDIFEVEQQLSKPQLEALPSIRELRLQFFCEYLI